MASHRRLVALTAPRILRSPRTLAQAPTSPFAASWTAASTRSFTQSYAAASPGAVFSPPGQANQPARPPTYFYSPRNRTPTNTVVRFVPQQTAWIVERMGKFNRILEPGLAILIPFIDRIAYVKSLKENAIEIPSQSAITADNVTLELDGVLYTRVFDAYKAR